MHLDYGQAEMASCKKIAMAQVLRKILLISTELCISGLAESLFHVQGWGRKPGQRKVLHFRTIDAVKIEQQEHSQS